MIYLFYSQRCLTFSCECVSMCAFMCVFISQDILVHLALSYLPLKSFFYFYTKPICGMDGFLLTFILTVLSAHISIYYPCVCSSPLQHNRIIIGGMVKVCRFEGTHRCCCQMLFFGDLYGLWLQRLWISMKLLLTLPLGSHVWVPFMMPPTFSLVSISSFPLLFFCVLPPSSSHPWWGKFPCLLLHHYLS